MRRRTAVWIGSLLIATLTGSTPALSDQLVELIKLDPNLRLDIRYATSNNFLGFPVYPQARAFLQKPAAEALKEANLELKQEGLGLLILDAYRPLSVTQLMWDETPASKRDYVADPKKGSRHNRGAAVDLTIIDLSTGKPVEMPSRYDDFSERAHHSFQGCSATAKANRAKLRALMEKHGFEPLSNEWWHYDFRGWEKYPILDKAFSEL